MELEEIENLTVEEHPDGMPYMCEDCGHEMTERDLKYMNYVVGKVLEVEEMKAPLKKCMV